MKNHFLSLALAVLLGLGLTACPPEKPVLQVSPAQLDFGTAAVSLPLHVTNIGTGVDSLEVELSPSETWVGVSRSSLSLAAGESEDVTVSVDRGQLAVGTASAVVNLTSNGGGGPVLVSVVEVASEGEGEGEGEGATEGEGEGEGEGALPDLGVNASLNGFRPFGAGDEWNRRVDDDAVAANSDDLIDFYGRTARMKIDAGVTEEYYGIPYVVVPGTQPLVNIAYGTDGKDYSDESDPGPMPIPLDAPIESGSADAPNPTSGDRHILVIDRDNLMLYELYNVVRIPNGFRCTSSAIWDLTATNNMRPAGWTSADAGGMPIFPGLLKYEEAAAGEITHALRVTVESVRRAYTYPGNHFGPSTATNRLAYGQRLRLKASFDETGFSGAALNIVHTLKHYGLIVADQGSNFFITGVTDPGWEDAMPQIRSITGDDLEVLAPKFPVTE